MLRWTRRHTGISFSIVLLAGMAFVYQNATPTNYLSYYNMHVAQCTGQNHSSCQGEVTVNTYVQGEMRGVKPVANITGGGGWYDQDPWASGVSFYSLFIRGLERKVVYRNTGAYVTLLKYRDSYFNPERSEEYSFFYQNGAAVSSPLRAKNFKYFYNFDPIPNDPYGLTNHIVGLKQSETLEGIGAITMGYDTRGKLTSYDRYGIRKDFDYDGNGNMRVEYNWRDGAKLINAVYSDYKLGVAQKIERPMNYNETKVVNNDGLVTSHTDSSGAITYYEYDTRGREKKRTPPRGSGVITTYPDANTRKVTRGPVELVTKYDAYSREIQSVSSDLNDASKKLYRVTSYDHDGNEAFRTQTAWNQVSPGGEITKYDILGRVIETYRNADGAKTTFAYSAPDVATITKPMGHVSIIKSRAYSDPEQKEVISVQESKTVGAGNFITTNIERDPEGKILRVKQGGVTRSIQYWPNQLIAVLREPEREDVNYTYYGGSKLIRTKQVGTEPATSYEYDSLDRQSRVVFADSLLNTTFEYDSAGRLSATRTPQVHKEFVFDGVGNKTKETLKYGNLAFVFDMTYNNLDQLETITYPNISQIVGGASSRNIVRYSKDALGNTTNVRDAAGDIVNNISYHPNGMFSQMTYRNGLTTSLALNGVQFPVELKVNFPGVPLQLNYDYNLNSNLTKTIDSVNGRYSQIYEYDGLNRLTSMTMPWGAELVPQGGVGNLGGAITYSDTGNITQYTEFGKPTTYMNYDQGTQQLVSSTGGTSGNYTYDNDGQITSNGKVNFNYNLRRNMVSTTNASTGALIANYVYDGSDIRVHKALANGQNYFYMYVDNRIAFEAGPNGSREYIYMGNNLVSTRDVGMNRAVSYSYNHFNPVSSTVAVSAADQSRVEQRYNSYGTEMTPNPNFRAKSGVGFAGHKGDDENGLIYMGARYYDPRIGRFLTPDPVGFDPNNMQSFNKYCYANNNPHKFVDPDGRLPILLGVFWAAEVAGLAMSGYDMYKGDYLSGTIGLATSAAGLGLINAAARATRATFRTIATAKEAKVGASAGRPFPGEVCSTNNCVARGLYAQGRDRLARVADRLNAHKQEGLEWNAIESIFALDNLVISKVGAVGPKGKAMPGATKALEEGKSGSELFIHIQKGDFSEAHYEPILNGVIPQHAYDMMEAWGVMGTIYKVVPK